jgi:hypothetical protein
MPRVSASVHYSPDFYLEAGDAVYVDGTVGMSLPYGFGYQTVDAVYIADLDVDGGQRELPRLARRDIEGGVGIRAGRQLLGMQRTRRSFADSGRRIAGARRGDDIPEILRALPRSGCRLTPPRRDPSVG